MNSNVYQAPNSDVENNFFFCRECGEKISKLAVACPKCGAPQNIGGKSKVTAGLLAIFLGAFGAHRFYLGQWWGIFYLLFFWAWIPGIVALIEGVVFLSTSDQSWLKKYGNKKGGSAAVIVLVVIFAAIPIFGILAAIAIPAYHQYVERYEQTQSFK